jgi:hypothetical protein
VNLLPMYRGWDKSARVDVKVGASSLPAVGVRWLVRWALREAEADHLVQRVVVLDAARTVFKGRCRHAVGGAVVRAWITSLEKRFPYRRAPYRVGAPEYTIADRWECLVAILGHEFHHARLYKASQTRRHSEADCERAAVRLLEYFRVKDGRRGLEAVLVREWALRAERKEKVAALRAPAAVRSQELAGLDAKIARWETKRKTAETYLKKYRRRRARIERAMTQDAAGAEPASRGGQS